MMRCIAGVPENPLQISKIEIHATDQDRHQHQRERGQHKRQKTYLLARTLGKSRHNQVGAGPYQTAITAQTRAQGQRPPDGHQLFGTTEGLCHVLDQRDHGGHEGDVVDHGGCHRRHPHDGNGGDGEVTSGQLNNLVGQHFQQAGGFQAVDHDEQSDKEKDGDPFHLTEGLVDRF